VAAGGPEEKSRDTEKGKGREKQEKVLRSLFSIFPVVVYNSSSILRDLV